MATITPENIAGLVVGEGCFYVESAPDPKYRLGWRIRPAFCIEMRAEERGVLEAVRATLDCGTVYDLDFGRYRGYEERGWKTHIKYRVTRISDLNEKVIPFFMKHRLFGSKLVAFELFSCVVDLVASGCHRTVQGLEDAKHMAEALRRHNSRGV